MWISLHHVFKLAAEIHQLAPQYESRRYRCIFPRLSLFAHLPWCFISRVLAKTQAMSATLVLVVTLWPTQACFPVSGHAYRYPNLVAVHNHRVLEPSLNCDCPMNSKISNCASIRTEGIPEDAVQLILTYGGARRRLTIILPGGNGKHGVQAGASILCSRFAHISEFPRKGV